MLHRLDGMSGGGEQGGPRALGFETWAHNLRARGMPCVLLKRLGVPGDWSIGGVSAVDRSHWDVRFLDSLR